MNWDSNRRQMLGGAAAMVATPGWGGKRPAESLAMPSAVRSIRTRCLRRSRTHSRSWFRMDRREEFI